MANTIASQPQPAQKFGTFLGVFTPSLLTILGLIMYLRFGWVVGNLGLPLTLFVVVLANSITFITALSASAIATNMRVGVGGEYYMVSRSLGLELGGAIGIPLFLCRTLSITFYSFGLAESLVSFWPAAWGEVTPATIQVIAAVTIVLITALSGKSAGLALRLQIPIMVAIGLSVVALILGVVSGGVRAPEMSASFRTAPQGFWYVFTVFFPAVTGFATGIGMSGDLKDPQKSIPRGTILAVITGFLTYISILVLLSISARIDVEELAKPEIAWVKVAVLGAWLVYPGVWGAILSSAIGSALSGPRVLQALAKDGLAPRFLAKLSRTGQPTIATWISGAIALAAVSLGELNAVAQFVTILFLTLYVTINLSAAIEGLVGDPSYRPTINVPWYVALLGSLGTISVMFLIHPLACVIAIFLEILLYSYLRRRSLQKRWGDVRAGLWVALARFSLLRLRRHESDPRNWRPQILLFSGDVSKRIGLVRLAIWFNQNRGLITACHVLVGDLAERAAEVRELEKNMEKTFEREGLVAFAEVNVVREYESGLIDIAQAHGMADLRSNTVMFGWPNKPERLETILRIMHGISAAGKSTIIAKLDWAHEPGQRKQIDIWWRGLQNNGDLMLLLAYLLQLNREWNDAAINIRTIIDDEKDRERMAESLRNLAPQTRIEAETEVIVRQSHQTIIEVMHQYSKNASLVFVGLKEPAPGEEAQYARRLVEMAEGFNTTIFVRNAGEFAGNLV